MKLIPQDLYNNLKVNYNFGFESHELFPSRCYYYYLEVVVVSDKSKQNFDVLKHAYVPKHEILPKKEADEILIKYNAKHAQLPFIFLSDPALRELGAKPGDVIKITRKSPTAGESIYYRYVVEG